VRLSGLWKHSDFLRLWSGQTISVFGTMIGGTAMSFTAILYLKATPFQMGVLQALQVAPALLVGLFAGAWVDRLRRRPILIWADIARAAVLATIPLAAWLGGLRIWQVYAVTLVVSILALFFDVAYQAYLPALVGKADVLEGNSKLSASAAVAEFGGFSIAGWLVQALTAPVAVLIDAVSFVVSALTLGWIRAREDEVLQEEQPDLHGEIVAGLRAVLHQPVLRACALAVLVHGLGGGAFGALVVLFMSRDLGFQPGLLAMTWAVGGLSSFLGAALASRFTDRLGVSLAMASGLALYGVSALLIPLAHGPTVLSITLLVLAQLGDGLYIVYEINLLSLRQQMAPERLLGRVNATNRVLDLGAALVGSLLGGLVAGLVGVRPVLVAAACGTVLAGLGLGILLRQTKEQ
jgi:MFS family permease